MVNYLNTLKFPVPGKARGQVPGTDQRNAIAYASVVDLDEAYGVGRHAVEIARKRRQRLDGDDPPRPRPAGVQRPLRQGRRWRRSPTPSGSSPSTGSLPSRIDVTDDFLAYARPLIGDDWVSVPMVDGLAPLRADHPQVRAQDVARLCAPDIPHQGLSHHAEVFVARVCRQLQWESLA